MGRRGSGRTTEFLTPKAGDVYGFRWSQEDEKTGLTQWVADQQIKVGEWSEFVRDALREKMQRQLNLGSDINPEDAKQGLIAAFRRLLEGGGLPAALEELTQKPAGSPKGPDDEEANAALKEAAQRLFIDDDE